MRFFRAALDTGSSLVQNGIELLYPPICSICERSLEGQVSGQRFVCQNCMNSIAGLNPPWCLRCGDPQEHLNADLCEECAYQPFTFEWARSIGWYDGVLSRLIQQLKYEGERALVHELAPLMAAFLQENDLLDQIEIITFVPMRSKDLRSRGFNQSKLLSRKLGRLTRRPVLDVLKKIKGTAPQMQLTGDERRQNLADAFVAVKREACKSVLLIDDVYTTGATARACSRALIDGGYERVMVLTLARTPIANHLVSANEP